MRISFVDRLNQGGSLKLPWHRAEKKVPHLDTVGQLAKPEKPNAVKLEQFVFDAIPLAHNAIVYETQRAEEHGPVKNAEVSDSPASSKRDQIRRAAGWLKAAGVQVPEKMARLMPPSKSPHYSPMTPPNWPPASSQNQSPPDPRFI